MDHDELVRIANRDFAGNISAARAAMFERGLINDPVSSAPQPDRMSDAISVPLPPRIEEKRMAFTPAPDPAPKRTADLTIPHGVKRVILEF